MKKSGNFKIGIFFDGMELFLYCLSSSALNQFLKKVGFGGPRIKVTRLLWPYFPTFLQRGFEKGLSFFISSS